jgi:tRNA-splicing ligase RtcB
MSDRRLKLRQLDEHRWLIPRQGKMRVDGLVYADWRLMEDIRGGEAVQQVANVACLPGIVGRSIGMPDIHWGYGFAIGGVAAFDPEQGGVVSPGGVGYDINCGVRVMRCDLTVQELRPRVAQLMDRIAREVPAGVGAGYRSFKLSAEEVRDVLTRGARWAVDRGYGTEQDVERIESGGVLAGADPDQVSARAIERGRPQLGTVGSGNHFIEIGYVSEVYDQDTARQLGLSAGTVTVFIHSGSRGLGHQVCTDYLDVMLRATKRHEIDLPDRQLACAPLESPEAKRYLAAMAAAANFAFANRQMMGHRVREAFEGVLGRSCVELGFRLVYDVAHNNAKWETHEGALLLRSGRYRHGVPRNVRIHVPRSRPAHEPSPGEASRPGPRLAEGVPRPWHRGAGGVVRDGSGGSPRGVQGCGPGCRCGRPGRHWAQGRAAQTTGRSQGLVRARTEARRCSESCWYR